MKKYFQRYIKEINRNKKSSMGLAKTGVIFWGFYFHKVAFSRQIYYIKSCSFKRMTDCVNVLK